MSALGEAPLSARAAAVVVTLDALIGIGAESPAYDSC
jgi:hypothetical protein